MPNTELYDELHNRKLNKRHNNDKSVPTIVALFFVCLVLGHYGLTIFIVNILPTPLTIDDEASFPDAFIAERAKRDLKILTSKGPRGLGFSENEVFAVEFFKNEVANIQKEAHTNQKIELDVQSASGSYFLYLKPNGFINTYANVQNVVVKLHSQNNSEHSLLINAHFDSFTVSPGATDDGINCAVILEILRKLSRLPVRPTHSIIFLFNGGEEWPPLEASHGFITQHKWAPEIEVVLNLEGGGRAHKEYLFQTGPAMPWLLKYYGQVPHPNGQVVAEEMFHTGIIPSDSDFRIFRDFGNTIGLDAVFIKDGYRYHTKYDNMASILDGAYQHVGDNYLTLTQNLANAPELANIEEQTRGNEIFFDYIGLIFIHYSEMVAIITHVSVVVVSTIIAVKSFYDFGLRLKSCLYLASTIAVILIGWALAAGFTIAVLSLLDSVDYSMSWYGNPWIVIGLYVAPMIVCCCTTIALINHFYNKHHHKLTSSAQAQIQGHLLRIIFSVLLLTLTFYHIRSAYLINISLFFQTLSAGLIQIFCLHKTRVLWVIVYILGTTLPNFHNMRIAYDLFTIIMPVTGRVGANQNTEFFIGLLAFIMTLIITSYYTVLITLARSPLKVLLILLGVFAISFIIVFTPLGFPYNGNPDSPKPQRFWIHHTSRVFRNDNNEVYKADAGYYLMNMDRNSPRSVEKMIAEFKNATPLDQDCQNSLFCGLPISPRYLSNIGVSTWIPAEQPIQTIPIKLTMFSKSQMNDTVTRFTFVASGPNIFTVYVSPRDKVNLVSTNLLPATPLPVTITWNNRPTYSILYGCGASITPLSFSLDFETPANWTEPTFDIALIGIFTNEKFINKTAQFSEFLNQFPFWTVQNVWLGSYESWVY